MNNFLKLCFQNKVSEVNIILDSGIDPNMCSPTAGTIPLQLACQGEAFEVAKLLISRGADVCKTFTYRSRVNDRIYRDRFPLMYARSPKMAELLVSAGAKINQTDGDGISALATAIVNADIALVEYYLKIGADRQIYVYWDKHPVSFDTYINNYRSTFPNATLKNQHFEIINHMLLS